MLWSCGVQLTVKAILALVYYEYMRTPGTRVLCTRYGYVRMLQNRGKKSNFVSFKKNISYSVLQYSMILVSYL